MIKFMHIRPLHHGQPETKGGMTIAYENMGDNTYQYAISFCHPKDNFCKRTGRVKAAGRMQSQRHVRYLSEIPSDKEFQNVMFHDNPY